ncbi:MAG: ParB/RepB/Spo0J family partition protein [Candidatus Caldatribacteriaceae bacterium]
MVKRGLGKGLEALIPQGGFFGGKTIQEVDINRIYPNSLQPRSKMDEEKLEELAYSIQAHGVLQPLLVRRLGDGFEIIAGERRWRAAKKAGLTTVPVVVEEADEEKKLAMALVENLQREDLNPLELARGIKKLVEDFSLTQEEVAQRIGKKRSTVANLLRLLELPLSVQELLEKNQISPGHAKALLAITSAEEQKILAERIVRESLSVREAERLSRSTRTTKIITNDTTTEKNVEELLTRYLSTKVQVGKGKIVIEYYGLEDLQRLYTLMMPPKW